MDFKSVIEFVRTYDLNHVHDSKNRYGVSSLLYYYYGECWYVGLLQCHDGLFVYIRHENKCTPDVCFEWYDTKIAFADCIYGWSIDENVIKRIMSRYKVLSIEKKYGLK